MQEIELLLVNVRRLSDHNKGVDLISDNKEELDVFIYYAVLSQIVYDNC